MAMYWGNGSMKWMEWLCLGGAGALFYTFGYNASVNYLGNPAAVRNHLMAYHFVKSNNRWEGRQILKNAPMMY